MMCVLRNSFLVVLFLCIVSPCFVYSMDEFVVASVSQTPFEEALFFTGLPFELEAGVSHWFFKNESLENIAKTFSCLERLNKESNNLINTPVFRQRVTKQLGCSDEEFIKATKTPKAKEIMKMQDKLFDLCRPSMCVALRMIYEVYQEDYESRDKDHSIKAFVLEGKDLDTCVQVHQIEELCNKGANLEFTYNKERYPKCVTPFMALCLTKSRAENDTGLRQIMKFFVDMHKREIVDIERVNPEGTTGFMESWKSSATHWVGYYFFRIGRCSLQHLNGQQDDILLINVNRQDNAGNTALLNYYHSEALGKDDVPESFIAAGANPEIANNDGLTPLKKLEQDVQGRWGFQMKYAYDSLKKVIENKNSR